MISLDGMVEITGCPICKGHITDGPTINDCPDYVICNIACCDFDQKHVISGFSKIDKTYIYKTTFYCPLEFYWSETIKRQEQYELFR